MRVFPHFDSCKCGNGGENLDKDHVWYVKSKAHSNCFWVYFRHNTRPHTLHEIAKLLGLSISAITSIERKASIKLRANGNLSHLFDLLNLEEK